MKTNRNTIKRFIETLAVCILLVSPRVEKLTEHEGLRSGTTREVNKIEHYGILSVTNMTKVF